MGSGEWGVGNTPRAADAARYEWKKHHHSPSSPLPPTPLHPHTPTPLS
ncbi:MAG: hypothetical protein DSM106950_07545 [Stigonema ocellatum SAG 48.90 = DSM 106950]|nr:hypothetical protein [Stigonema ocellatum SAG 48.90 = DSM 106950]